MFINSNYNIVRQQKVQCAREVIISKHNHENYRQFIIT